MKDNCTREKVEFASSDGKSTIRGYIWKDPSCIAPRGIVQLVHGMAEHITRYDDFARFLVANGFAVVGHSHIGHGKSVESPDKLGCMPAQDGANIMVEDVHRMRSIALSRTHVTLPYFIFGHSMGSFITRSYITRYPQGLNGAIICGTGHIPPAKSRAGKVLAKVIGAIRGHDHKSKLLDGMSVGGYGDAIENARTKLDWLSTDENVVDAYIADDECGFMFSASANAALTELTGEVCDPASTEKIPKGLPLFYIAGGEDPVGDMGEGVKTAAEMAKTAGVSDVEVRIYEGMRHEILNERENERVYDDVLAWIEKHL